MSLTYAEWNQAILDYFFSPDNAHEPVRFFVEPRSLRLAAAQLKSVEVYPTDEEAERGFLHTVNSHIRTYGWSTPRVGFRSSQVPDYLCLLALQVLAGYTMRRGEKFGSNAYWPRLRELLGQSKETKKPDGLDYTIHDALWEEGYRRWLELIQEGRRGLPRVPRRPMPGRRRRHIAWPLAQVLLRKADLDRMRTLYHEIGFKPGEELSSDEIREQIDGYLGVPSFFTQHALRILTSEDDDYDRVAAACEQIADHLARWDGRYADSRSPRKVELQRVWIHWHKNEILGGLLERDTQDWLLERDKQDWRLVQNSPSITQLLREESRRVGRGPFWLFVYDEGECRFINRRSVRTHERAILIAPCSLVRNLKSALKRAGADVLRSQENVSGSPSDWTIIEFHAPPVNSSTEEILSFIRAGRGIIRLHGGLKLRRTTWMAGAGPWVQVIDNHAVHLMMQRENCAPGQVPLSNGRAQIQADEPGTYAIWIPGQRRFAVRFHVRRPARKRSVDPIGWPLDSHSWPNCCSFEEERRGVIGMLAVGSWERPPSPVPFVAAEQALIRLAILAKLPPTPPNTKEVETLCSHPNQVVKAVALGVRSRRGAFYERHT